MNNKTFSTITLRGQVLYFAIDYLTLQTPLLERERSFVVGLTLHMADIPVSDNSLASKNINASNLIRFIGCRNARS